MATSLSARRRRACARALEIAPEVSDFPSPPAAATPAQSQVGRLTPARAPEGTAPAPFSFTFRPPRLRWPKKRHKKATLVPDALLGIKEKPKKGPGPETPKKPGRPALLASTSATSTSDSSKENISEKKDKIESDVVKHGEHLWYPQFYEMKTSDEVHQKAQHLSLETHHLFNRHNHAVRTSGHKEKEIQEMVCDLGNHVRVKLSRNTNRPTYGVFVPRGNRQMANVSLDDTSRSP